MRLTRKAGKIEALREAVKGLDGGQSKVGWFPSAVYEGGQPVAGIAAVQEFGSTARGIPPRSFFRTTATEKREEWKQTVEQVSRAAARGNIDPSHVMEAVAMAAGGHVAATIAKITTPALAASTIAARKRRLADKGASLTGAKGGAGVAGIAKPLVDTGIMLATLSYEANGKETLIRGGK
jgi:hypothetical protein